MLWIGSIVMVKVISTWAAISKSQTSALVAFLVALLCVVVMAGAAIRRVRDLGHSGWWALSIVVPFVGLYFLFAPGTGTLTQYEKANPEIFEADKGK